jgi:hypothetical protein
VPARAPLQRSRTRFAPEPRGSEGVAGGRSSEGSGADRRVNATRARPTSQVRVPSPEPCRGRRFFPRQEILFERERNARACPRQADPRWRGARRQGWRTRGVRGVRRRARARGGRLPRTRAAGIRPHRVADAGTVGRAARSPARASGWLAGRVCSELRGRIRLRRRAGGLWPGVASGGGGHRAAVGSTAGPAPLGAHASRRPLALRLLRNDPLIEEATTFQVIPVLHRSDGWS